MPAMLAGAALAGTATVDTAMSRPTATAAGPRMEVAPTRRQAGRCTAPR